MGKSFEKGQFFSPDLIIALLVFLVALAFFAISFAAIDTQADVVYTKNMIEESAHTTMNSLVYYEGEPFDWQNKSLSDINYFGLVDSKNVLNKWKMARITSLLDTNYAVMKEKLSLGKYDLLLELIDSNGSAIYSGGILNPDYYVKLVYYRIVYYDGRQTTLKGMFSYVQ